MLAPARMGWLGGDEVIEYVNPVICSCFANVTSVGVVA